MNNNNAIDINKIMVNYGGKYLSLKECAEMFNLDPNILAGEYINNGDIFSSIMNASHKKVVLEAVSKYIISSSATDLIDKIIYSEDFIINMSKKDASNLYNIITHYTIPFELISKINNYYLLCDDMDKLITPKTNNNMSKIKK